MLPVALQRNHTHEIRKALSCEPVDGLDMHQAVPAEPDDCETQGFQLWLSVTR
jgi:hypothetical protein